MTRTRVCYQHERPSAARRGYDRDWRRIRQAHLIAHPTCVACGAPADVVDHIDGGGPHGAGGNDPENLQSMCSSCHSRKTVEQDGGFGRGAA